MKSTDYEKPAELAELYNLLRGFRGLEEPAKQIAASLPQGWGADLGLDDLFASPDEISRIHGGGRLPGVREAWVADDPAVIAFHGKLEGMMDLIPNPDDKIVRRLGVLEGFERKGKLVLIDGVPVPAGVEQCRVFANLRWRCLSHPLALPHLLGLRDPRLVRDSDLEALRVEPGCPVELRHLLGYDAAHTTNEEQERLLAYSADIHRRNLVALMRHDPPLFLAVWRHDFENIKRLARGKGLSFLVRPDPRHRRLKKASKRLVCGTAIMAEFERACEVCAQFGIDADVTKERLLALLRSVSSIDEIHMMETKPAEFIAGMVAHHRSLHPSMNEWKRPKASDPLLKLLESEIQNTATYESRNNRLRKPLGEMPAKFFCGIEPQFLAIAAVIMIIESVQRMEPSFTRRTPKGHNTDRPTDGPKARLGTVIMSNICNATAQTMADWQKSLVPAEEWCRTTAYRLISNQKLRSEYENAQQERPVGWEFAYLPNEGADGENEPKAKTSLLDLVSIFSRAKKRAAKLPKRWQPGWTRGFRADAWLYPNAERAFLKKCCRHIQYIREKRRDRIRWVLTRNRPERYNGIRITYTGLPTRHPVMSIQSRMRPIFDKLQYADRVAPRGTKEARAIIDAFVTQVAKLMSAVTPITVDPFLNEMILRPIEERKVDLAVNGAWNLR